MVEAYEAKEADALFDALERDNRDLRKALEVLVKNKDDRTPISVSSAAVSAQTYSR